MLTSIMTIVIVAFVCGLGLGFCWNTKGGKKMMDAEKELNSLRSALAAKQSEVDQAILMHDKSIAVAYSVVLDYEDANLPALSRPRHHVVLSQPRK